MRNCDGDHLCDHWKMGVLMRDFRQFFPLMSAALDCALI